MIRYSWSLTSLPLSLHYPLPAPKAFLSDTFPNLQCAASPTYTLVKPKPMPVMQPSSRCLCWSYAGNPAFRFADMWVTPVKRGNKTLKRVLFLSAFASLRDPISRAYYTRKMSQGKRHNQALITLARRRCDALFALMRDGTFIPLRHHKHA